MDLTISHLTKKYKTGTKALDDITATLSTGVHGILGPNGAGKTTMMQILTCNLKLTCGDILWNGESILHNRDAYCAALGYMPQQQAMYPSFTAEEYLRYMATLRNVDKRNIASVIQETLLLVNLLDVANKKIATFSGGMKQRLLLAQAVLTHPQVLILDEPTAGLDPYQRISIRNIISELSANCIVLLATHVVPDIEVIAKDIMLLQHGKLKKFDSPGNLCESIKDKVFEVELPDQKIPKEWRVSNVRQQMDGKFIVRILADSAPAGYLVDAVEPTLEDVYLYEVGAVS